MLTEIDHALLLGSSLVVVYAVPRSIRKYGGFRQGVRAFLHHGTPAEPVLLFLLLIPLTLLALYYILLCVPGARATLGLVELNARPSVFTTNVILAVFFLNGRLVRRLRQGWSWSVALWNRFGIFRI